MPTLRGFLRVLKPGGLCIVGTPDLHVAAYQIVTGSVNNPIYGRPLARSMLWTCSTDTDRRLQPSSTFMAHKTGFTSDTLAAALKEAGFARQKSMPKAMAC